MPKIIENLDQKILSSARELFRQQGYDQTNMRQIAEHTKIAVGTLYHYFSDKEDLYLHILVDSWKQTKEKLEDLAGQNQEPTLIFRQMLDTLIRDLQTHQPFNQLWREVAKMHAKMPSETSKKHDFEGMHNRFSILFSQVLVRMFDCDLSEQDHAFIHRLGSFAFIMAVDSCMLPEEEIDRQAEFISDIFITYIEHKTQ